ncbi:hypothetical protein MRX96_014723 [Rhipicephalus microplus]
MSFLHGITSRVDFKGGAVTPRDFHALYARLHGRVNEGRPVGGQVGETHGKCGYCPRLVACSPRQKFTVRLAFEPKYWTGHLTLEPEYYCSSPVIAESVQRSRRRAVGCRGRLLLPLSSSEPTGYFTRLGSASPQDKKQRVCLSLAAGFWIRLIASSASGSVLCVVCSASRGSHE